MTARFAWHDDLEAGAFPAAAYNELLLRLPTFTPFNRLSWLRAMARHLRPGQTLHVLIAWQDARLVLCLPLLHCRERQAGLPLRVVRHLGYPLADRIVLAVEPGQEAVLMDALPRIRRALPHALLQLDEILPAPASNAGLTAWGRRGSFRWENRLICLVPEYRVCAKDRDEPAGDARYKLRRARKRSAAIGAAPRRARPDADTMDALLARICAVERISWKGAQDVGIFSSDNVAATTEALRALAAEDRVRAVLLEHEGRCISYRLGLLEQGRLYDYSLAFMPAYAALGSGRLLLDEWIRWGLDEGWQWIDASRVRRSHSRHQLRERMSGQIEHRRWRFYSCRPGGLAFGLAYGVWQLWRRHVRRSD
ncbi:MAG: GNAT family N-acetyltransferase [Zoogloeaceae bacterium]|jgi:CelD/BcsL family acetyltransferase involved in cellulose biosynthesis|nr:GNAT family N-acetyltransferase [Zoogloeaceae bacterium]